MKLPLNSSLSRFPFAVRAKARYGVSADATDGGGSGENGPNNANGPGNDETAAPSGEPACEEVTIQIEDPVELPGMSIAEPHDRTALADALCGSSSSGATAHTGSSACAYAQHSASMLMLHDCIILHCTKTADLACWLSKTHPRQLCKTDLQQQV